MVDSTIGPDRHLLTLTGRIHRISERLPVRCRSSIDLLDDQTGIHPGLVSRRVLEDIGYHDPSRWRALEGQVHPPVAPEKREVLLPRQQVLVEIVQVVHILAGHLQKDHLRLKTCQIAGGVGHDIHHSHPVMGRDGPDDRPKEERHGDHRHHKVGYDPRRQYSDPPASRCHRLLILCAEELFLIGLHEGGHGQEEQGQTHRLHPDSLNPAKYAVRILVDHHGDEEGQPAPDEGYELVDPRYEQDVPGGGVDAGLGRGTHHGDTQEYQHQQKRYHPKDHHRDARGDRQPPELFGAGQIIDQV